MVKTLRTRAHRALIATLKAARQEQDLSQRALAARLHKPQSYVSKIESGERRLDVVEFCEVAQALELTPEELFTRFRKA